jgi:hypothetical protein
MEEGGPPLCLLTAPDRSYHRRGSKVGGGAMEREAAGERARWQMTMQELKWWHRAKSKEVNQADD